MMTLAESEKTPERSPESAQLDEAAIRRLQDDLPDDEVLYDLAELFRVFGDSTRIKILYALFESELCVNDIAQVVGISQSAVSHQLRLLKTSKLVKFRREGKAMYYSLDDDHVRSKIPLCFVQNNTFKQFCISELFIVFLICACTFLCFLLSFLYSNTYKSVVH